MLHSVDSSFQKILALVSRVSPESRFHYTVEQGILPWSFTAWLMRWLKFMTQYDTTGTVNLFIKISSVNQTLYWGRSHQTLQTLWDISFSVVIPPPPPGFIHLKQFFVKSWIQDTLQRKMRYNENKSVVNVNALVVTGKAIYVIKWYVILHLRLKSDGVTTQKVQFISWN